MYFKSVPKCVKKQCKLLKWPLNSLILYYLCIIIKSVLNTLKYTYNLTLLQNALFKSVLKCVKKQCNLLK